MRIATWNVNSLRARLEFVTDWLNRVRPDVCCLQETKTSDDAFPAAAFAELGYASAHHGNGRWNGVAILSSVGLDEVRAGFSEEDVSSIEECRILAATCDGVRVISVYVPNGRALATEHYDAKLAWLEMLRSELASTCAPGSHVAMCGDFNIAPGDRDVWDVAKLEGMTHVSDPERSAFQRIIAWGLVDSLRTMHPDEDGPFSWWDYRAGSFHKGWGMRIDHVLLSAELAEHLIGAYVDREARKKNPTGAPSDHAPVVVEFELPRGT